MRLKRLELCGYKSFASRTVFEFNEGIVAVIGPNGSGKSNIADAIRWVMGEQSYNSMRAKTTEDMIFAGSGGRARSGMAEVLITLDNSEGIVPLPYSEVVVGRRAYRSGDNEYLINGNQVRYRDVLDILSGAGLMRSRYTVIGQGMVDAALALRPEARRALFEEAAGVSQHLRKRDEALRRIQETERNLERVDDILQEIAPRARGLRRQAERAEEHELLRRDLEEHQRLWYGYQWGRRQHVLAQAEERVRDQAALLTVQRRQSEAFARTYRELCGQHDEHAQHARQLEGRLASVRAESEARERELAVNAERLRLFEQQHAAGAQELAELQRRYETLSHEAAAARDDLQGYLAAQATADGELSAARTALLTIERARKGIEEEARSVDARLARISAAITNRVARLEQTAERRAQLSSERQISDDAARQAEERLGQLRLTLTEAQEQERSLALACAQAAAQRDTLDQQVQATRGRLAEIEREVARLERARDGLTSRLEVLSRLRQELTGFHPGVRAVLATDSGLRGLLGTVVSLMQVPEPLEEAIESALGPRLQNIVAESWDHAAEAIAHLKRSRGGWATFLPLDTVSSRAPLRLRPEPGIVGVGSELVSFEPRLRAVFEMLLGRVVVVEDLPTARRLLTQRTGAALIVTLAGDTVQPSGAVSGGTRQRSSNLLAQEREWAGLPARIDALERALCEARAHGESCVSDLEALQRRDQALSEAAARLRRDGESAQREAQRVQSDLREAEREVAWRSKRLAQADQELAELDARERRLQGELETAQTEQEEALAALQMLRERLANDDGQELRQRVAEVDTRAAVARRAAQGQQALLASHEGNLHQTEQQLSAKRTQVERLAQSIDTVCALVASAQQTQCAAQARLETLEQELAPCQAALHALEGRRSALDAERAHGVERVHDAELAHSRAILARDRARDDLTGLAEEVEANLGPVELPAELTHQLRLSLGDDTVELPRVESVPPGLSEQVRQLRIRLRRLGAINPDAPREYEHLLDRQTFLEAQKSDLRGAIASLHEVIEELDAVIERDFGATVRAVDASFSEYFGRLFGGGHAKLVLTDPDDLSKTGVDIIARPPGKKPQNLSLLSGGERALTAVALLFALLKANPVPFCCLDEVDAALDEANVQRFRALLEEHTQHTQFVIITHNRHTVDAASTIYGISMSERGVSQSISLRLPERRNGPTPEDDRFADGLPLAATPAGGATG